MKTKCINDPNCSGFSWPKGFPPPLQATSSPCRKNNLEEDKEGDLGWGSSHQYFKCDCMRTLLFKCTPSFFDCFLRLDVQSRRSCGKLDQDIL